MTTRSWAWIHKWSSLVCTLFMLLLCITGLPLIFHEEIEHLSGVVEAAPMPEGTPNASLDRIAQAALAKRPDKVIRFMFWEQDEHPDLTMVSMSSRIDAPPEDFHILLIDSRTAQVLDEPKLDEGFMYVMLKLHVDMFAGLPGQLFLGFMGLLMVVAIVSGVVLYYPFMKRLKFGALRTQRSARIKWLDWHNLLGVVTVVWLSVVGITGTINTLNLIVIGLWQMNELAEVTAPYKGQPPIARPAHLQTSIEAARAAAPDMKVSLVAFPGTMFSSPHHYNFLLKGNTPVTSRLLKPVLVDAASGKLTDVREAPWYAKVLLLSQPLHFGDYGGLPLKILWAVLDIFAIVVLGTGVYLWLRKPKASGAPAKERATPADAAGLSAARSAVTPRGRARQEMQ